MQFALLVPVRFLFDKVNFNDTKEDPSARGLILCGVMFYSLLVVFFRLDDLMKNEAYFTAGILLTKIAVIIASLVFGYITKSVRRTINFGFGAIFGALLIELSISGGLLGAGAILILPTFSLICVFGSRLMSKVLFIGIVIYLIVEAFLRINNIAIPDFSDTSENIVFVKLFSSVAIMGVILYWAHQQSDKIMRNNILELKKTLNERDDMVNIVCHDIATPLTVLKGRLEIYTRNIASTTDDKTKMYIDRSQQSIEQMESIISSVREMQKIESGLVSLDLEALSLTHLIENSVSNLSQQIKAKNIDIILNIAAHADLIEGDAALIENNILNNLLSNAIKFTEMGGMIEFESFESKDKIILEITDYGTEFDQGNFALYKGVGKTLFQILYQVVLVQFCR
jgi:signal transduction histidine kinase